MYAQRLKALIWVTTTELLKKEVCIATSLVWLFIMLVVLAFGTVSIGDRHLVVKDFGLFITGIFVVLLIILGGASMLANEIKRKSIYTVLSKPIGRNSYLWGKFLGLFFASFLLNIFLHLLLIIFILLFEFSFDLYLLHHCYFLALESLILSSLCLLLSTIMVTPSLVGILTACLFIIGRNIPTLIEILENAGSYQFIKFIFPNLYLYALADQIAVNIISSFHYFLYAFLYSLSISVGVLFLSMLTFKRRDFT